MKESADGSGHLARCYLLAHVASGRLDAVGAAVPDTGVKVPRSSRLTVFTGPVRLVWCRAFVGRQTTKPDRLPSQFRQPLARCFQRFVLLTEAESHKVRA